MQRYILILDLRSGIGHQLCLNYSVHRDQKLSPIYSRNVKSKITNQRVPKLVYNIRTNKCNIRVFKKVDFTN